MRVYEAADMKADLTMRGEVGTEVGTEGIEGPVERAGTFREREVEDTRRETEEEGIRQETEEEDLDNMVVREDTRGIHIIRHTRGTIRHTMVRHQSTLGAR